MFLKSCPSWEGEQWLSVDWIAGWLATAVSAKAANNFPSWKTAVGDARTDYDLSVANATTQLPRLFNTFNAGGAASPASSFNSIGTAISGYLSNVPSTSVSKPPSVWLNNFQIDGSITSGYLRDAQGIGNRQLLCCSLSWRHITLYLAKPSWNSSPAS